MTTRRERARTATIEEIKEAALNQLAAEGPGALSIRGIARAIGMSPAGLYRYFDGLDSLLTELITDAYNDLADAVETVASQPGNTRERLRGGMLAYRRWCVDNPNRFLLLYGTPIPGYAAPTEGPTALASRRIGKVFFSVVAEGWHRGELRVPDLGRPPEQSEVEFAERLGADFPAEWVAPFLGTWAHFHGMVTLEILNQLDWIYPDAEVFYLGEIDRMIDSWA
ncbi:MAG: TetR/AcrR family transcriptional regulator [Acidimicrobiia bacterium]|nr:TetR/AcrR family transcriptional regulator [Acidimicrobiia bacterium]